MTKANLPENMAIFLAGGRFLVMWNRCLGSSKTPMLQVSTSRAG